MTVCPGCKQVEVDKEGKLCHVCRQMFVEMVESKMRVIVPKYCKYCGGEYESPEWRKKELGEP